MIDIGFGIVLCYDVNMKSYQELVDLLQNTKGIIGIDGPCASGKTTLAEKLSISLHCPVIHMDDFFLRPFQRSKERLQQPGGNIDIERFLDQVGSCYRKNENIRYQVYDCHKDKLSEWIEIPKSPLYILEGSYAHHPNIQSLLDVKIFLAVSKELQKKCLRQRNPILYPRFEKEWIPLEEYYFSYFDIPSKSDYVCDISSWNIDL